MRLTLDQRAAVNETGRHVLVVACPGSGKTRTIVARLMRAVERVRGTPRRVACITYTNAAASEIEARLRSMLSSSDAEYCDVGTIHAFCLRAILRPAQGRLPGYERALAVAAPDSEPYQQAARDAVVSARLGRVRPQDFEQIRRGPDGRPLIPSNIAVTESCVRQFWTNLQSQGLLDFPSITYFAYTLVHQHSDIARSVSSRYRELLIDEMQDTDSVQIELFRCLARAERTMFFMVGDPNQSIYGFAGASPQRMTDFATELDARTDFHLRENWRSSRRIVTFADALCPRDGRMEASGPYKDDVLVPAIQLAASATDAVTGAFLPALRRAGISVGRSAVLAPAWYMLFPIARELRRLQVPVSGPGSRPYKRASMLAGLLENLCACMPDTRPDLLRRVQREMFDLVQRLEQQSRFEAFGQAGRRAAMEMVFRGRELRHTNGDALSWIDAAASSFASILAKHSLIAHASIQHVREAGAGIVADIRANLRGEADHLTVDDLGTFANPDGSMKLLTLHAAKGREFEAVCVVELQEDVFPHRHADVEEARRVLYVGVTRPYRLLQLSHARTARASAFLREAAVVAALAPSAA